MCKAIPEPGKCIICDKPGTIERWSFVTGGVVLVCGEHFSGTPFRKPEE